jgi:hypothetical protein
MRHVTGYLWRFVFFRVFVLFLAGRGIGSVWLWRETPLGIAMHRLHLADGDYPTAAECSRLLK